MTTVIKSSTETPQNFAIAFGSIATYPEDVETVEEAIEWEDFFEDPEAWSGLDGSDTEDEEIEDVTLTENGSIGDKVPILSEQLRETQQVSTRASLKKEIGSSSRASSGKGKIAKVSKLLSAVSYSRTHKNDQDKTDVIDDDEPNPILDRDEVAMFRKNYSGAKDGEQSEDDTEVDFELDSNNSKDNTDPGVPKSNSLNNFPFQPDFSEEDEKSSLFFIFTYKKRGRQFEELARKGGNIFRNCAFTKSPSDIEDAFVSILNQYEAKRSDRGEDNLRIVLAGNDSFVNYVARIFVELLAKKSRSWCLERMRFYLVPLGVTIDLARHLASVDPLYKALFFSPEWEQVMNESTDPFPQDVERDLVGRVERYLQEGTELYKFDLGEAFLTQVSKSTQQTIKIPFLKGVRIGTINTAILGDEPPKEKKREPSPLHDPSDSPVDRPGQEVELQLDYWISKKKGETQVAAKGMFGLVGITRLWGICNVWRIDPSNRPSSTSFAMLLQFRDRKRGFVKATAAMAGKSHSRQHSVQGKISKLTCSLTQESQEPFRVAIDGIKLNGVKFLSVTPQWGSHVKYFPVCLCRFDSGNHLGSSRE